MESLAKVHQHPQPLHVSLHRRWSFTRPISSVSSHTTSSKLRMSINIRAVTTPISSKSQDLRNSTPPPLEVLKPFTSFLKTTSIALAAAALFFSRFSKPSFAAPLAQPTTESAKETPESDHDEEKEKTLEENLESNPDDVKALRSLMEVKIKARKFQDAISVIDRLIGIEPSEREWPLLKAHIHNYSGDVELAMLGFEQIISKDPLCVEAYHGLVMATSQTESGELGDVLKRIESAMEKCKKDKRKEDFRDFKLLVAQIKVIEGNYTDALKVYQELVKEEPRDFRPYLCQGIIYTLLQKKDEAEKQFQKYRRLVPKEHPNARFFDDNMLATKVFSQMAEDQRTGSKK